MNRCLFSLFSCLVLTSRLVAAAEEPAVAGRVSLPRDVVASRYDLDIKLDQATDRFSGTVKIAIQVNSPTSDIVLNAADLETANLG